MYLELFSFGWHSRPLTKIFLLFGWFCWWFNTNQVKRNTGIEKRFQVTLTVCWMAFLAFYDLFAHLILWSVFLKMKKKSSNVFKMGLCWAFVLISAFEAPLANSSPLETSSICELCKETEFLAGIHMASEKSTMFPMKNFSSQFK